MIRLNDTPNFIDDVLHVDIYPGDDANAVIAAHPPGTTFLLKRGVHNSLLTRGYDTYLGEYGSVIDASKFRKE